MDLGAGSTTYFIVLAALLGIFAALGYRDGWVRGIVFLGGLGLGYLLLTEPGAALFRALSNQFIFTLKLIAASGGDFQKAAEVAKELAGTEWVNDENQSLVLTLALAFVLLVTYMLGTRFRKKQGVLGALLGAANGYLIVNLLVSYLTPYLPKWVPVTVAAQPGTADTESTLLRPAVTLSDADFKVVITLFLATILVMIAISIRPKKKKES
jgi:hypothetical protein